MMDDLEEAIGRGIAHATEQHFAKQGGPRDGGGGSRDTDSKTALRGGWAFGPDWTSCIFVFLFTSLVYGGFVALQVARFGASADAAAVNNNNGTGTTTAAPGSGTDASGFVAYNKLVAVVSLAITGPVYILAMSAMFLATFTDPGILPRAGTDADAPSVVASVAGPAALAEPTAAARPAPADDGANASGLVRTGSALSIDFPSNRPASARNSSSGAAGLAAHAQSSSSRAAVVVVPPTTVPPDSGMEFVTVLGIDVPTPKCTTCQIRRPLRASHCVVCQNCVLDFDHHCGVIGACVGRHNVRYFLTFVWSTGALAWLCAAAAAAVIAGAVRESSQLPGGTLGGSNMQTLAIALCVVSGLIGLQLGCNLSCFYAFLVVSGFTYREHAKRDLLYGGRGWRGESPFRVPSVTDQCAYLCCPLPADADVKAWTEQRNGSVRSRPLESLTLLSSGNHGAALLAPTGAAPTGAAAFRPQDGRPINDARSDAQLTSSSQSSFVVVGSAPPAVAPLTVAASAPGSPAQPLDARSTVSMATVTAGDGSSGVQSRVSVSPSPRRAATADDNGLTASLLAHDDADGAAADGPNEGFDPGAPRGAAVARRVDYGATSS